MSPCLEPVVCRGRNGLYVFLRAARWRARSRSWRAASTTLLDEVYAFLRRWLRDRPGARAARRRRLSGALLVGTIVFFTLIIFTFFSTPLQP